MWTRWRLATAPSAVQRTRSVLRVTRCAAPTSSLHARTLTTSNGPLEVEKSPIQDDDQALARRSLHDLSRVLRAARTAKQLTTMWSILSRRAPVVVDGGFLRPVGAAHEGVAIPDDSVAMRMVSLPEMLQLVKDGKRHTVVEHAPSFTTSPGYLQGATKDENDGGNEPVTPMITVPKDRVVLLSEHVVARKILWALHRLGCHLELTQFLEAFEAERATTPSSTVEEEDASEGDDAVVAELATLGHHIDALYVASLGELRQNAKLLARVERVGGADQMRYLVNRDAFRSLLNACVMERNGSLARRVIDQALDAGPTLTTFNVRPFTSAIHSNLRGATKTLDGLENAMHIYRRMFHEVGYILAPPEWSMLFNACVYLGQHDLAMEVFRDYRAHGIAPFQKRFQQALRTACRNAQYDTAVEMARTWIEIERDEPSEAEEDDGRSQREAEAESLNRILWEMLKGSPTRDQVEQILVLAQARGFNCGALVVRRVVAHFFTTASESDQLAPEAVLYRFFDLWERVPTAIQRTSFVLHLVLEECEQRDWSDQCERVIAYALEKQMELPIASTAKLMDRYASRGDFDEAIQLGELVVQPRLEKLLRNPTHTKRARQAVDAMIPDAFFESLLRCYLFRERFDDVVRLDDAFQLTARRGSANVALATILRDARAMAF